MQPSNPSVARCAVLAFDSEELPILVVVKVASDHLPREVELAASPYVLEPLHPGSNDPSLTPWFVMRVEDPAEAEDIAGRLRTLPGVDAAYVEPPAGPPA